MRKATAFDVLPAVPFSRAEWVAGCVVLEGMCRGQWERHGRLLAPDLQRHLHGIVLRKATAFDVFPQQLPHLCVVL